MKFITIIIIICFVLINTPLYSDTDGYCEIGYDTISKTYYTNIMVYYNFDVFFISNILYGGINVLYDIKNLAGRPFKDIYVIGDKIQVNDIYFGFEHFCVHPVKSGYPIFYYEPYWNVTKMFVGIEW